MNQVLSNVDSAITQPSTTQPAVAHKAASPVAVAAPSAASPSASADPAVAQAPAKQRLFYLDNLRVVLTMLVLFHHTAIAYGGSGGWYFKDPTVDPNGVSGMVLSLFTAVNQTFFMGLFFFISAFFVPGSYDRKGAARFLGDRLLRLGVPILVYLFGIAPALTYWLDHGSAATFWQFYSTKILTLRYMNFGPQWFTEALVYFAVLYAAWRWWAGRRRTGESVGFVPKRRIGESVGLPPERRTNEISDFSSQRGTGWSVRFPSNRKILTYAVTVGLIAFIVRLAFPTGTGILGLQFGYFPAYICLFLFGLIAYRANWLGQLTDRVAKMWLWIALASLPILPVAMLLAPSAGISGSAVNGGFNALAFVYAMWEPFVCIGLCMWLLVLFRRRLNHTSWLRKFLSDNAFAVYIIHPPVIVAITKLLVSAPILPLIKWAITGSASAAVAFVLAAAIRKVPGVARIV